MRGMTIKWAMGAMVAFVATASWSCLNFIQGRRAADLDNSGMDTIDLPPAEDVTHTTLTEQNFLNQNGFNDLEEFKPSTIRTERFYRIDANDHLIKNRGAIEPDGKSTVTLFKFEKQEVCIGYIDPADTIYARLSTGEAPQEIAAAMPHLSRQSCFDASPQSGTVYAGMMRQLKQALQKPAP